MSRENEEHENFKGLKKLVLEVGLPLVRKLFESRYRQNRETWQSTPEFGKKLWKMLDSQNNGKETEIPKNYEERQNIKSGKLSNWDYTILQIVLTQIQFDLDLNKPSASASNANPLAYKLLIETQNKMVQSLTKVRNKLAHDYFEKEKIPTGEFKQLWNKAWDSCLYLGADAVVMNDICPSYLNQKDCQRKSRRDQSSSPGEPRRNNSENRTCVNSAQPRQEKNTTITTKIKPRASSVSSTSSMIVNETEKRNAEYSIPKAMPRMSSNYPTPVLTKVHPTVHNNFSRPGPPATRISVVPSTFSSPSARTTNNTTSTKRIEDDDDWDTFLSSPVTAPTSTRQIASSQDWGTRRNYSSSRTPLLLPSYHIDSYNSSTNGNTNTRRENNGYYGNGPTSSTLGQEFFHKLSEITWESAGIAFLHLFFLSHAIFLLVISSGFLRRVVQQVTVQEDFPHTKWIGFTNVAVNLGIFRINLSIISGILMCFRGSSAGKWLIALVYLVYLSTVLVFGGLALCFVFTNFHYSAFLDPTDVEGSKNYHLYRSLIAALLIEPGLFTVVFCCGGLCLCFCG